MKSLTEYISRLIERDAKRVIAEHEAITLEGDVFDRFTLACDAAAVPNQKLREARNLARQALVHDARQGKCLGKTTLICALEHALRIDAHLPSYAVVVDALNDDIQLFYEPYGFQILYRHNKRARLFLPMKTVAQLFSE